MLDACVYGQRGVGRESSRFRARRQKSQLLQLLVMLRGARHLDDVHRSHHPHGGGHIVARIHGLGFMHSACPTTGKMRPTALDPEPSTPNPKPGNSVKP